MTNTTKEECPFPVPNDHTTLKDAVDYHEWLFDNGELENCSVCEQIIKQYPYGITGTMLRQLRDLYKNRKWIAGKDLQHSTAGSERKYSLLRFWGLVEGNEKREWHITQDGIDFIDGNIKIPKNIFLYDNMKIDESEEKVDIYTLHPEPFDLEKTLSPSAVRDIKRVNAGM